MPPYVIQLSDLHFTIDQDKCYLNKSPEELFCEILELVQKEYPDFEWLILTGDLAHDEKLTTYMQIRSHISKFVEKCWIIPGNHDQREYIKDVFPENINKNSHTLNFSTSTAAGWRLIGLDSQLEGRVYGGIGEEQLEWLEKQLQLFNLEPSVIFVHHPPFQIGSAWLDKIGLKDPEGLLELLQKYPQVKALFSGHIHQDIVETVAGIPMFGAPSTATQFRQGTAEAEIENMPPGFRVIWFSQESINSKVVRI